MLLSSREKSFALVYFHIWQICLLVWINWAMVTTKYVCVLGIFVNWTNTNVEHHHFHVYVSIFLPARIEPGESKGRPWPPKIFENLPIIFVNSYTSIHLVSQFLFIFFFFHIRPKAFFLAPSLPAKNRINACKTILQLWDNN